MQKIKFILIDKYQNHKKIKFTRKLEPEISLDLWGANSLLNHGLKNTINKNIISIKNNRKSIKLKDNAKDRIKRINRD